MRALMFSDWCVVKKYLAHYLLTSLVIGGFTAMGNASDPAAMVITMTCCMCYTSCLFIMFALFGADDRGEWARGCLELLPIGRADVVKARYAIMALAVAATMAAGLVASLGLALVMSLVNGSDAKQLGLLFAPEPASAFLATIASLFAILAIQMPLVFSLGVERGKIIAIVPLLLIALLGFEQLRRPIIAVAGNLAAAAAALPTPAVALGILGAAAAILGASARLDCQKSMSDTRCPFTGGGQDVRRLPSFLPLLRLLFSSKVMLGRGA